ncbi:hypothetical protein IFR05_017198, partial [Cadophora sp. M221]
AEQGKEEAWVGWELAAGSEREETQRGGAQTLVASASTSALHLHLHMHTGPRGTDVRESEREERERHGDMVAWESTHPKAQPMDADYLTPNFIT